eukprot:GFKZ01009940.1.p1 GENE.GFKZ01009940.1~~GFKZ01009940.1.p1  ORF type:complete len:2020 (-),score=250.23 GFKZ01009940.1:752-6811(-)
MDSDDERNLSHSQSKQYAVLRSDLVAALAAFDRAQDWADLIHDLQRVNRVLNKHSTSTFLPEKALLAKRLSQCLTSFLPSGVHLKALETYHLVFKRIGPARLARDLPLYAGGLFPLFSHCATSIKAPLLSLYETYFVPLGVVLCPVLDGFVLAVLPGVEDESSEFYFRSRNLLDRIAVAVKDVAIFARSLWRALLLSPPMRLSAAHYLRHKLAADNEEFRIEMVRDMPLVAHAITAALSDDDALTQRSVLDLLLGELALDSPFFQANNKKEQDAAVAVVGGVFGALMKRDMSLTKRVHAWLLGGKDSNAGIEFCANYSNELVLAAMDSEVSFSLKRLAGGGAALATRPCRISGALMNRAELSRCLGHHLALRVLKYGRAAGAGEENEHDRDIRHSISDLLQDLGSGRVFAELEKMVAGEREKTYEDFELLSFALSMFPTTDEIVRRKHLPALLRVAVQSLNAISTDTTTLDKAVSFCSEAIQSMRLSRNAKIDESVVKDLMNTVSSFASFFVAWLAHVVESAPVELRRAYSDVTIVQEYAAEVRVASVHETRKECITLARSACAFFVAASEAEVGGTETLRASLQATAKCANTADVRIALAGARAFSEISSKGPYYHSRRGEDDEQALGIIRRCWRQMHPSLRTATPQSAQVFLSLQRRFPEEAKNVIADGILSTDLSRRLRNLERFACLWRLSVEHRLMPFPADNGLFLMLDALTDEDWAPKMLARSWLSDALEVDASSVLDAPLRLLLTPEARTVGLDHEFSAAYDAPRALYGFQVLRGILESCTAVDGSSREQTYALQSPSPVPLRDGKRGRTGVRALAGASLSPRTNQAMSAVLAVAGNLKRDTSMPSAQGDAGKEGVVRLSHLLPATNYVVAVALACLSYLRGHVPERFTAEMNHGRKDMEQLLDGSAINAGNSLDIENDDFEWLSAGLGYKSLEELHAGVCAAAAECLATLFRSIPMPSQLSSYVSNSFAEPVLTLIRNCADTADPVLQLHFLNTVSFLVTADGPCYFSSIRGKEAFTKPEPGRIRLSYSDSHNHLPGIRTGDEESRGIQVGAVETLSDFIPWLLEGVSATCRGGHPGKNTGSNEVLGVRRRWILFIETVIRNVGVTLPIVTEGLLLIISELLQMQKGKAVEDLVAADSEFSRVDETLVLLEGLAVVVTNVLWSFEYALSTGDLNDDSQAHFRHQNENLRPLRASATQDGYVSSQSDAQVVEVNNDAMNAVTDQNGHVEFATQPERTTNVTTATAMMNAINPLRMINDFVKDVLGGTGSDGSQRLLDPRRSGARILFFVLPVLLERAAQVWGPLPESLVMDRGYGNISRGENIEPPRLSTEIPKERRQAQRASVLAVMEPIFELRPTDVVASVIALFSKEQDEYGAVSNHDDVESPAMMASQMLHAIEDASPEVVVGCVKRVFDKCVKWDLASADARDGAKQASLRENARRAVERILGESFAGVPDSEIKSIGRVLSCESGSALPGGSVGLEMGFSSHQPGNRAASSHTDIFYWGDFFAVYSPGSVETACFNFLDVFLRTRKDAEEIQPAFSPLYSLLKDALANSRRKGSILGALKVLGAFISRSPSPFPDRKLRRDVMTLAVSAIITSSSLAAASLEISSEELGGHSKDIFKKELAVLALHALGDTVPGLVDSSFLDEKPQLSATVSTCLAPAVAALRKAAGRAASKRAVLESNRKLRLGSRDESPKRRGEHQLDIRTSKASTEVLLQVSRRDWGVKLVRRDLVTLLEDANFFFGKEDGVIEKMSKIVREVIAGGGAATVLNSIGSPSSNGAQGIPSLFAGRDSETVMRARAIRRIAFCVFVSEPDFYSPQLPFVLERIRDALRVGDSRLIVECLLCLRALLLRIGPSSVSAFRATTLSEIFRIAANPGEDLNATLAALKFLDLTTLLSPADFGYERCFFFGEGNLPEVVPGSELKAFRPLARSLSLLWTAEDQSMEETFKAPFRLERGRTVLAANEVRSVDKEIIGRYAKALEMRNAMPDMKAVEVDRETICNELEKEFVQ